MLCFGIVELQIHGRALIPVFTAGLVFDAVRMAGFQARLLIGVELEFPGPGVQVCDLVLHHIRRTLFREPVTYDNRFPLIGLAEGDFVGRLNGFERLHADPLPVAIADPQAHHHRFPLVAGPVVAAEVDAVRHGIVEAHPHGQRRTVVKLQPHIRAADFDGRSPAERNLQRCFQVGQRPVHQIILRLCIHRGPVRHIGLRLCHHRGPSRMVPCQGSRIPAGIAGGRENRPRQQSGRDTCFIF